MNFKIRPSQLNGVIDSSPSKSQTLRAILFASLATGKSKVRNYLQSPDATAMISACSAFGAKISVDNDLLKITGVAGKPKVIDDVVDCGNSGQVLRFVSAIAALTPDYTVLTGDASIRHNRPMQPLIDGLNRLGTFCVSTKNDGYAPIVVGGPLQAGFTKFSGEDSQPVSAMLMATVFLPNATEINIDNPGEKPWIDLTLSWLDRIGARYENKDYERYLVHGNVKYAGFDYSVPADFSSLLFPVVAALITQSEITLQHVDMSDPQGDKKVIEVLQKMGANIVYDAAAKTLQILPTPQLTGIEIDVNEFIDAVPILAVVGCYATGATVIKNAAIARQKECDRLTAVTKELKKMGADITELTAGLSIKNSVLKGAKVATYNDHRLVMALSVAALGAVGETVVVDAASVSKSYPNFHKDMLALGADISEAE